MPRNADQKLQQGCSNLLDAAGKAQATLCELQRHISKEVLSPDWHQRLAWLSVAEVQGCYCCTNIDKPLAHTCIQYNSVCWCRSCWNISKTFRNGSASLPCACSFWRTQKCVSARQSAAAQGYLLSSIVLKSFKACRPRFCRVLNTTGCVRNSYM